MYAPSASRSRWNVFGGYHVATVGILYRLILEHFRWPQFERTAVYCLARFVPTHSSNCCGHDVTDLRSLPAVVLVVSLPVEMARHFVPPKSCCLAILSHMGQQYAANFCSTPAKKCPSHYLPWAKVYSIFLSAFCLLPASSCSACILLSKSSPSSTSTPGRSNLPADSLSPCGRWCSLRLVGNCCVPSVPRRVYPRGTTAVINSKTDNN